MTPLRPQPAHDRFGEHRRGRRMMARATVALCAATVVATPPLATQAADASKGGALDTSFNKGGAGADGDIDLVAFGTGDSIYIVGDFTTYNGTKAAGFARLKSDGTLDTGFNPGTAAPDDIYAVTEMPDGDVYVGGTFDTFNGVAAKKLVRLNKDGSVDTGFTSQGFVHYASASNFESVRSMLATSDGKLLVSGYFDNYGGSYADSNAGTYADGIIKLNADGTPDSTFTGAMKGQTFTTAYATTLMYNADKTKITAVGSFFSYESKAAINVTRFANDGKRDATFLVEDVAKGPNNNVRLAAQTSDGKYYFHGSFSKWFDVSVNGFVRTNADGTRDTSFSVPGPGSFFESIAVDAQDRLYVTGRFITWGGSPAIGVVRLKADGTIDPTFDTTAGAPQVAANAVAVPAVPTRIAVSPGGKVIIYGDKSFNSWAGTPIGSIGRLIPDGKPGPVGNVTVTVTGSTAKVSWTLPKSGGPVESITATATPVTRSSVRSSVNGTLSCTVPGSQTSCEIKGLVKGKTYTFSVTTSNGGGSAAPAKSAPVTVGTPADSGESTLPATGSGETLGAMSVLALMILLAGSATLVRRRIRSTTN